jgi:hypothetical protein
MIKMEEVYKLLKEYRQLNVRIRVIKFELNELSKKHNLKINLDSFEVVENV